MRNTPALSAGALLVATLLAFLGAGILTIMRAPKVRAAGMAALHSTHFDHDVHPNRETRRSMHKRLKSLWMLSDESGSVTTANVSGDYRFEPTADGRALNVFDSKGALVRSMPIISGGAPGAELLDKEMTVEGLSSTSTESLRDLNRDVIARCEELTVKATEGGGFHTLEKGDREALRQGVKNIQVLAEVIAEREGDEDTLRHIREAKATEEARKTKLRNQRPEIYETGNGGRLEVVEFKTPGELFTDSDQYADFLKRGAKGESDVMPFPDASKIMGLRTGTDKLKMRAPITGADASAGNLVQPQFLGLVEPGLVRPLTIRDLVTVLPTDSDAIEYVKEATRASNAAPVTEAEQLADTGDETATKPEGGLTFAVVTDTVKIIAEWVAVTTKILQDAPQLRAYIDEYLLFDLALELEDQMIAGDGTGENFTGILNTAGIQTVGPYAAGSGPLENLRKGITLVEKNGRTRPNAIVVSPEDSQMLDLLKVNDESNHFAGSGPWAYQENQPIWAKPRVVSEAQPTGSALVGNFKLAILWDRMQAQISVGTVGDDFIRNLRRILAEGRWGFGVRRPKAFCEVDLTEAP